MSETSAEKIRAALADLPDDTPLMQTVETTEAWGGRDVGERESGATVGDIRALLNHTGIEVRPGVYHVAPNDGDERPDEDEFTYPRPVSPEAAPRDCIPLSDADREAKLGKMHGTLLSPNEAERVRRMLDEPETAPPRATTPPKWTPNDPHGANVEWHLTGHGSVVWTGEWATGHVLYGTGDLGKFVASPERVRLWMALIESRASNAPSRESGALLDDYALWCKQVGASLGCSGEEQRKEARAALDRHIASLERDAARMREENALLRNVEAAARRLPRATPRGGGAGTLHAFTITAGGVWANDIALTKLDEYRAALAPSGEPTT